MIAPAATAQDAHTDDHDDEAVELGGGGVESTRSRRRVSEEPIRVEVIQQEEIEEKLLMTPGNIAMLVAETGGVRVQVTSPALGASNIRMQGMRGRYTQLLADGLPLYGGQASSIGLLQIPPTDLARVEIIKGAASALYGPSALGGVINLISRRPRDEREAELLLNTTSRDGRDVTATPRHR
ncbi:MAG: TonB-dependent receptor plug domain-containing protein [Lysobacter sp.]